MDTEKTFSGKIIERQRGNKRYYYYSRSYRVKLDPEARGKAKGGGKSRVVNEQTYLGTAETVLHKLLDQKGVYDPVEIHKKQFGLPVALFEMAERIGQASSPMANRTTAALGTASTVPSPASSMAMPASSSPS